MFHNIRQRAPSGFLLASILLGVAWWAPSVSLCVVLATVSTVALIEFYHLLDLAGIPTFRVLGALMSLLIIVGSWATCVLHALPEWETFALTVVVLAMFLRLFPQKNNTQPLATVGCTLLGVLYVPFLMNYFINLAFTWDPPAGILERMGETGRIMVLYLVAVVKVTDIGAYVTGSLCGKHKMIPRISPGKTWEGFVGGIGAGLLMSLAFYVYFHGTFGKLHVNLLDAIILGLILPLIGTAGDLTESMLKRASGAKDSSVIIPGMGGALDVLDSLLFAVPILYMYARLFLQ